MELLAIFLVIAIGSFGWGMLFQEWLTKRRNRIAKEHRIVIDAPFASAQAHRIMHVLLEIHKAISKSVDGD